MGGLVLALLATVLPIAQQIGSVDAEATGLWQATGPGTVNVVSNGSNGQPSFSYDLDLRPDSNGNGVIDDDDRGFGVPPQSWTFSSESTTSGNLAVPYTLNGFHAYFQVRVGLQAFVTRGGNTTYTSLVNAGPVNCCTSPSGGFAYEGTHTFDLAPGDVYGFVVSGSNGDYNSVLRGTLQIVVPTAPPVPPTPFVAAGEVADNTSWSRAQLMTNNVPVSGTLLRSGETRWYKFPVTPDSQVQVTLSELAANFDLAIYRDIEQAFVQLTTSSDLARLGAQFAADAYSPSIYSPSIYSPSIYSPSIYSPSIYSGGTTDADQAFNEAFTGAQTRSLITVSALDGVSAETIRTATWNNTGNFYVRVSGRNGASSATPFSLELDSTGGPCNNITIKSFPTADPLAEYAVEGGALPPGASTIILTDTSRFEGPLPTTYLAGLGDLAADPINPGIVVDLNNSPRIRALNDQADDNVSCAYLKNVLADAIRDIVVAYRAANPATTAYAGLEYVVIAGGDDVVPFFRYADGSGLGPESDYIPPLRDGTASETGLRSNSVLGQDAYGSTVDLPLKGTEVPIPDLPVGRLVETPAQITGQIAAYLNGGQVLQPTSSLVTGYDFLTTAADAVRDDFAAGLGGVNADTLITDQGVPTTDTTDVSVGPTRDKSWTADDLRSALASEGANGHDLYFIAGHFSANSTLAADYTTSAVTTEFVNTNVFSDSLVISPGCHSGFNIQDEDGVPSLTEGLDWAQLMAEQHATLIAGTGYQYADTDFLAYSAKLYTILTEKLRVGTGAVSVGEALMDAKRDYLEQTTSLSGIDKKSVIQATLYGLPMKGVDFQSGRTTSPTATGGLATTAVGTGPGAALGLRSAPFTLTPTLTTPPAKSILGLTGNDTGNDFRWLSGTAGVQTAPAVPALPKQIDDVTSATGEVLRGVGFEGGSYTDLPGVYPLTGAPATEQNGIHTDFNSPVFWPQRLATVNYFDQLGGSADGRTRLVSTPAQYRSDPGAFTSTERRYSSLGLRLYYSSNIATFGTNTPALAAPPSISQVTSAVTGSTLQISAAVTGDPSAGIQRVWVTWTGEAGSGPLYGAWALPTTPTGGDFTQSATDSTMWSGQFPLPTGQDPSKVRFIIQAVNGVGLVGLDNNLGDGYTPGVVVGGSVAQDATPSSLAFEPTVPTAAPVGSSISVGAELLGAPEGSVVTFSLAGASRSATTTGGRATAVLPVQGSTGSGTLTVTYAGTDSIAPSAAAVPFVVQRVDTTVTVAGSTANKVPGGLSTDVTATLRRADGTAEPAPIGQQSITFTITGGAANVQRVVTTDPNGVARLGRIAVPNGSYTVTASFAGTPTTFAPSSGTSTFVVQVGGANITALRSIDPNANGWNNTAVTVSFICADDVGAPSCPVPQTVSLDGEQTVIGTATDLLGNTSTAEVLVRKDGIPPTISGEPATPANENGWYNTSVTIDWTCADDRSGIDGEGCDLAAGNTLITGDGTAKDATRTVLDKAGNPATATSTPQVKIDTTKPFTIADGAPAGATQVTITLIPDDNLSGVATTQFQVDDGPVQTGTSVVVTGTGPHTLKYWSTDRAGNVEDVQVLPLRIDAAAPDVKFVLSPAPNADGWNRGPVTVTFTCIPRGVAIIEFCSPQVTVSTEGKAQPVPGTARTETGITTTETAFVSIDKTAPTIAARPSNEPNAAGWYRHPVNVQFKCTDALSGVKSCTDDVTLRTDGVRNVPATATDAAGNTTSISFGPIRVDRTAPVVRIVGVVNGSTHDFASMPTPSCQTTDALSGVAVPATLRIKFDGPVVKVRCDGAEDVAGNKARKATAVYRVRNASKGISDAAVGYVNGSTASNKVAVARRFVNLLRDGDVDRFVTEVRAQVGNTLTTAQADQLVLWSGLLDDDDDSHDDDDD